MTTPNNLDAFADFMAGETIRLENENIISAATSPDMEPEKPTEPAAPPPPADEITVVSLLTPQSHLFR
jgi:hypothetical protein